MRPLVPLFLFLSLSLSAAPRIEVPRAQTTPKIDGDVTSKEWKDAVRVALGNDAHALLQHNGTHLFVALVGRRNGIGSLCTTHKDDVRVLHASAALGTAVYRMERKNWINLRPFTWTNRDTGSSPEAMAARKTFLETEGWFANARPDFAVEREFQIRLDGRHELPMVLGFMGAVRKGEFELSTWPERAPDSCGDLDLYSGYMDREYTFDPKTWGVVAIR